jgi:hypothetical protein
MAVTHAARDCSGGPPISPRSTLSEQCTGATAAAPAGLEPLASRLPHRVPSSTPDVWRHPTDPFQTSAHHLKWAPPVAAPFFLSLPHSLPFSSKTEPSPPPPPSLLSNPAVAATTRLGN